jgi:hypothetical protein
MARLRNYCALLACTLIFGCSGTTPPPSPPSPTPTPDSTLDGKENVANSNARQCERRRWSFEGDALNSAPNRFLVTQKQLWAVRARKDAPSQPHALEYQPDAPTPPTQRIVMLGVSPPAADFRLSVRCTTDQVGACGTVFRAQNEENYYAAIADSTSHELLLIVVVKGNTKILARKPLPIKEGVWNQIWVTALGEQLTLSWNKQQQIAVKDSSFSDAGKVGLCVYGQSKIAFDNLNLDPLHE